jgi:TonB family protein
VLRSINPTYPIQHPGDVVHPTVVVTVTLNDHGDVVDARIDAPYEAHFDAAALATVRDWQFAPALRDGQPVPSRIRVAVHFEPPLFEHEAPTPTPAVPVTQLPGPSREEHAFGATGRVELQKLRERDRGASDFTVERDILELAPSQEGADVLRRAPGVFLARPEGDAVGHRIVLRGFDADHGQDLALSVGGIPINLPSHIHGQGYADLGFLIGETVSEMRVTEGVSDPRQGDFAVAGSIDLALAVERAPSSPSLTLKSSYGSFQTFRQLALWTPAKQSPGTFASAQVKRSDGFGQGRDSLTGSAIAQYEHVAHEIRYRTLGVLSTASAGMAGVLREDDIAAGNVAYYDQYPYATAQNQSAATARMLLGTSVEYRGAKEENADFGAWLSLDHFRLQENFTGFVQRSQTLSNVAGRGDLIEQRNKTLSLGLNARYRTANHALFGRFSGQLEAGFAGRLDQIEQAQNLLDAIRSQTWDRRVDASIRAVDLGFSGEAIAHMGDRLSIRAGVRADLLNFEVDDRLGNFIPPARDQGTHLPGFRRSAAGVVLGPRASVKVAATRFLSVLAGYGEGFRSPQARTLEDGEQAPFTKVRSADAGVRLSHSTRASLSLSTFWTHLSDDVAFEPREGRLERIGASRRMGSTLYGETRWWIFTGAASLTYVDAELLEPPPPTANNPQPPFAKGQNLPFVPPVVARLDLSAKGELWDAGARAFLGKVAAGYSLISARPLPYGEFAEPVSLLDATASLSFRPFTVGLEIFNLLDAEYAASVYNFVSNWNPEGVPSRTPERHIAAGAPRTIMATLEIAL